MHVCKEMDAIGKSHTGSVLFSKSHYHFIIDIIGKIFFHKEGNSFKETETLTQHQQNRKRPIQKS